MAVGVGMFSFSPFSSLFFLHSFKYISSVLQLQSSVSLSMLLLICLKKKKKKMEKLGRLQLSAAREDAKAACRLALAWPCKTVFL